MGGEAPEELGHTLAHVHLTIVEASYTWSNTRQCIYQKKNASSHDLFHSFPNHPALIPVGFWTTRLINFYPDLGYRYFHYCSIIIRASASQDLVFSIVP